MEPKQKKHEPLMNWFGKIVVGIILTVIAVFISLRNFYTASGFTTLITILLYLVTLLLILAGLVEILRKILKK